MTDDPTGAQTLATYANQLDSFRNQVIGTASEDLCLARIPGRPYGDDTCANEDPNRGGGDIPNLVAQAFLFQSKNADVSIQTPAAFAPTFWRAISPLVMPTTCCRSPIPLPI